MMRGTLAVVGLLSCFAATAQAHFIWADFADDAKPPQVRLCFGESAEPGEARLIGKIAHSKAWVRGADGVARPVTLQTKLDEKENTGVLVAASPLAEPISFEATCDYGVYQGLPGGVRLFYYAKHLADGWPARKAAALQADGLALDIVPSLADGKLDLLVRFNGRPDAGREVTIEGPAGADQTLKTDDSGRVSLEAGPGRYAIRAGHVDAQQKGSLDDKSFARTSSYATLTLRVPGPAGEPAAAAAATGSATGSAKGEHSRAVGQGTVDAPAGGAPSAAETLRQARRARAVWENFPGYTADVTVEMANEEVAGKVALDADGDVTVQMPEGAARQWVETQLASLAQHRMPDGEVATGAVTFADDDTHHPLGRRLDLGDPKLGSVYRIRDNVIYEVNRNAGPMRFTIRVLEVTWNRDKKYLPRSFTMNFFDAASGELKQTTTHLNEWERVGDFDLPKRILEFAAGGKAAPARQMVFSNYRLSPRH